MQRYGDPQSSENLQRLLVEIYVVKGSRTISQKLNPNYWWSKKKQFRIVIELEKKIGQTKAGGDLDVLQEATEGYT